MTFKIGDIVKFNWGSVYGMVVAKRGQYGIWVQWFDETEAHCYSARDLEKVSDV